MVTFGSITTSVLSRLNGFAFKKASMDFWVMIFMFFLDFLDFKGFC